MFVDGRNRILIDGPLGRMREVVHRLMKEREDGKVMDRITSEDPELKRQTVEAFLALNQNTDEQGWQGNLNSYVRPGTLMKCTSCRRIGNGWLVNGWRMVNLCVE